MAVSQSFQYIAELDDRFLALFPHRGDYIWAEHPDPGNKPNWKTESRHFLSDRLIQQGAYLYGVRFGAMTQYLILDIDRGSPYHPQQDPQAIRAIVSALEPLGLIEFIALSSSSSGGIHLYFPFTEAQKSYELAFAVKALLANAGYKVRDGWLEIYPNPKPYVAGTPSLYKAHRLPLQNGSYLLNDEWQPIYTTPTAFVSQWQFAQTRNDISRSIVTQISKQAVRKQYEFSTTSSKFLNDLEAEIAIGWTGKGQTNRLLGRIALREYIFAHVLRDIRPLEGEALVNAIVQIAQSLPGYQEWCQHQHEIEQLAQQWARSVEANRRYYHYGTKKTQPEPKEHTATPETESLTWNQRQSQAARERIRAAIATMLEQSSLPGQKTARREALRANGIANATLDKHQDLWWGSPEPAPEAGYHPTSPDNEQTKYPEPAPEADYHPIEGNKLYAITAGVAPQEPAPSSEPFNVGGSGGFSTGQTEQALDITNGETNERGSLVLSTEPIAVDCSLLPLEVSDVIAQIQIQVRQLGLSAVQIRQLIGDRFAGKSRWQLSDEELRMLLQDLWGFAAVSIKPNCWDGRY